ncbi:membrane protein [Vibrio cholerae]|jgi:hypothetical protein|uniref:YjcZ family sporulation protein n=1 Tax=Vibrio spartinae TaxID=1918945 RepID=A0A1N6M5D0_9VIBR|nr:hypothetical protein FIV04_25680 [Vibrio sp. THAF190c]QMV15509.1 hypothetical protein Vspart_02829 [Vibrio spartinae]SUP06098.1 Uncharacterised protein [Vibrio cincinnatiensis]BCK15713.1 hypothetical protein VCSRO45_3334 [Vibrio cholerae]SIO94556.1 hypothetical protein VSP9026_02280 [Vibrio spartinae]
MSCCNKAPNGGSSDPKLLLKLFIGLFVIIFLVAFIFG